MKKTIIIFFCTSLLIIAGCQAKSFDSPGQTTIEVCEDLIKKYIDPINYIQPMHHPISYFHDRREKTVTIQDIRECSKGNGMSMQPSIFEGNTVCIKEFRGTTVKVGDIIEYTGERGSTVIHRVRAVYDSSEGKRILVQGDGLEEETIEYVDINAIKGIVVAVLFT